MMLDFCKADIRFMDKAELIDFLWNLEHKKVVLVMSKRACARFQWEDIISQMENRYSLLWIDERVNYPTQKEILMGVQRIQAFDAEVIVAVGGGSTIDFAKALKAFCGQEDHLTLDSISDQLKKKEFVNRKNLKLIAIPTTAGSGSELTKWATIWDYNKQCKYSIDQGWLKPDLAIMVPEFALEMNQELTITTGLDSLSHAVEAYWSKQSNPFVRELSKHSIGLTVKYLPQIIANPNSLVLREKQTLATVFSGLAFSITRTTASHSISYPLTMQYGISHGMAVALTLNQVAEKNSGHYQEEEGLLDLFQEYGGIGPFFNEVCKDKLSLRLRDYQIKETDLAEIAKRSFTLGRMDNNPVALTETEVEELLRAIW